MSIITFNILIGLTLVLFMWYYKGSLKKVYEIPFMHVHAIIIILTTIISLIIKWTK